MKASEMLRSSKKSMKHLEYTKKDNSYFKTQYVKCALDLIAVKEATGIMGSFANKIFEFAKIKDDGDLIMARCIGNKAERDGLDTKHIFGLVNYKDTAMYKTAMLLNKNGKLGVSPEFIEGKIKTFIEEEGKQTQTEIEAVENAIDWISMM